MTSEERVMRSIPLSSALVVVGFCHGAVEGNRLIRGGGAYVDGVRAKEDFPVVTGQMISAGKRLTPRLLAFADEGSGIGELREALKHADEWLTNQRHTQDCAWRDDDHCDCGLAKLVRHIDEALALSQSS